ncbi:hypothetical protein ACFQX6_32270 [Streptosporangium lutulentum]
MAATPRDHPNRALYLSNLGIVLQVLFVWTRELAVLGEAVQTYREAVAAAPPGHPRRFLTLSNLGRGLRELFEETTDPAVLAEAVGTARDAVRTAPADAPYRPMYLNNLGLVLRARFQQMGDVNALAEARGAFAEAARSMIAPVEERIRASRGLGGMEMAAGDGAAALAAYEDAVALLPQVSSRRLARMDREHVLGEMNGLAAEVAAAALRAGRPARAVELLEQARGVLLSEAMDARGDLGDLRARAPALAAEFGRLRDELDAADHTASDEFGLGVLVSEAPEILPRSGDETVSVAARTAPYEAARRLAERRWRLALDWDGLLGRIRDVPGFEGFLLPPSIDDLRRQAVDGPVVMVNVSEHRCDALVLTADADLPVRVVELPALGDGAVTGQVSRFYTALGATGGSMGERRRGQREMLAVLGWLWDAVAEPVLAELGFTGHPGPGRAGRACGGAPSAR